MLHYKESFLEESYATVNFLQPSFLQKGGLKTFPASITERRGVHNQNVTISLTRQKVYHNQCIPSGIASTTTTRPRIYAALETF